MQVELRAYTLYAKMNILKVCIGLGPAILVGSVLRLYLISDQILLDDEWHGLYYVIGKRLSYLLAHFSMPGATCIPMNIYRYFLMETVGWTEILLRLPAIISGLLALLVFPLLAKKQLPFRGTVIFTYLLAISPFLVFYSRVSRPYSVVALSGFIAVLSAYFWLISGRRLYGFLYVSTGIIGIYFHLFAAIAVLLPLALGLLFKAIPNTEHFLKSREIIVIPLRVLLLTIGAMGVILCLLILPGLLGSMRNLMTSVIQTGHMTIGSLGRFACMISGTSNIVLVVIFLGLLVYGAMLFLRRYPLFGVSVISIFVCYFLALTLLRPDSVHAPIVISRYSIPVYPLSYFLVAMGLTSSLEKLGSFFLVSKSARGRIASNMIAAAFLVALFLTGPLPNTYFSPNNFTNHSAFQESYKPLTWDHSFVSDMAGKNFVANERNMPSFYQQLSNEPDTMAIIEYPMMLGDHFNLFYYYQHFHGKKVITGYIDDLPIGQEGNGFVYANMYADEVLSHMNDIRKVKFINMIDMTDIEALGQSPARYIILHKHLLKEMFPNLVKNRMIYTPVFYLSKIYRKAFGQPVFEDQNIIVFEISR